MTGSGASLRANIYYFDICFPMNFLINHRRNASEETMIEIILFQYISGMATGGQASNVSYSSVSQSSDGGIYATGSGPSSGGMWRHTSARSGPRRERAIRFRDAWLVTQSRSRRLDLREIGRIVSCSLILSRQISRECTWRKW